MTLPNPGEVLRARVGSALCRIFDEASEARLLMDVDRHITLVNQACERTFGSSRDQMIGQRARMLTLGDSSRTTTRSPSGSCVKGGTARSASTWAVRADGSEFPVRVVCRMLSDTDHPSLLSLVIVDRSDPGDGDPLRGFLDTLVVVPPAGEPGATPRMTLPGTDTEMIR